MRYVTSTGKVRYGTPPLPKLSLAERFWEKVNKKGPKQPHMKTRCWVWIAGIFQTTGYGQFVVNGMSTTAHRVAWGLTRGPVPRGKFVLHQCDHRPCVRHLFLGTQADNMEDKRRKGRAVPGMGRCKLTDDDVRTIRILADEGVPLTVLAERYKVHESQVSRAVHRKSYQHVWSKP